MTETTYGSEEFALRRALGQHGGPRFETFFSRNVS
jgi:hypothetical protein